jgi:hypothetical protein
VDLGLEMNKVCVWSGDQLAAMVWRSMPWLIADSWIHEPWNGVFGILFDSSDMHHSISLMILWPLALQPPSRARELCQWHCNVIPIQRLIRDVKCYSYSQSPGLPGTSLLCVYSCLIVGPVCPTESTSTLPVRRRR